MVKYFVIVLLLFVASLTQATTYYFSMSGSDSNNGLSMLSPKKTITHLNTLSLNSSDSILFKRGETWSNEPLIATNSGISGNKIVYGAYGTGEKPIITGFTTVTLWTNLGSNIWESTNAVSTLSTCNMVTINDVSVPMGRTPNSGSNYTFQSYSGTTQITSSNLNGTPNWTNADAVVYTNAWIIDRVKISSQSGSTLNFASDLSYTPDPTYYPNFFITNDARTLDTQNEWYYNPTTKKIRIYSTTQPSNVKVSTVENLITVNKWYLTFENLSIHGANTNLIYNSFGGSTPTDVTFQNCEMKFAGENIANIVMKNWTFVGNLMSDSNHNGIYARYSSGRTISNNTIQDIGIYPGMVSGSFNPSAINITGNTTATIEYNTINNCGYNGITCGIDYNTVRYNLISNYCTLLNDGGGIYTFNGTGESGTDMHSSIYGNIVVDSQSSGIYLDENSMGIEVYNNTIANVSHGHGIFMNNPSYINIHDNTTFNCENGYTQREHTGGHTVSNMNVQNNIFVAKESTQTTATFYSPNDNIGASGTYNNNVYARPIDDNLTIRKIINTTITNYSLSQWQTYSSQDANSTKSPKTIISTSGIEFRYNETSTPKQVSFSWAGIDMNGTPYSSNPTLQPYTSLVLIKNIPNPTRTKKPAGKNGIMYKTRTGLPIGGE